MASDGVNFADYKVTINLTIIDLTSMAAKHLYTFSGVNVSGIPLDELVYSLETDDPTTMRELNLEVRDANGKEVNYLIDTCLPTKKSIVVPLKKLIKDREAFLWSIAYIAYERDRFYNYYPAEKIDRLNLILEFPADMKPPHDSVISTPIAMKIRGAKGTEEAMPIMPLIELVGIRSIARWSFSDVEVGYIYRMQW